jgi:hypothetical protein
VTVLERYTEQGVGAREVVLRVGGGGTRLVIDRPTLPGGRERLLAQLDPDEPSANAAVVCRHYLSTPPESRSCRSPRHADDLSAVSAEPEPGDEADWTVAADGVLHAIRAVPGSMSIPELRWTRRESFAPAVPVSLRSAIAKLESYEPMCAHTKRALARHDRDPRVSSTVLRTELARVLRSPIVLNRGLREAVVVRVRRGETTMSEIAIRCGRLKHDPRGNRSGETSWLSRRIGLLPEGGHRTPTPWVHSDVLALIAREGLGIAPREVELG